MRMYKCFVVNRQDTAIYPGRATYFDVYSVRCQCSNVGLGESGIRFVQTFKTQYNPDGNARADWKAYVTRVCRAWNAILLACHLAGLTLDCPPLILADAVEDVGEPRLADLLRTEYAQGRSDLDGSLLPAAIPDLPAGAPEHSCIVV
jgi:hypothetical protein